MKQYILLSALFLSGVAVHATETQQPREHVMQHEISIENIDACINARLENQESLSDILDSLEQAVHRLYQENQVSKEDADAYIAYLNSLRTSEQEAS